MRPDIDSTNKTVAARIMAEQQRRIERQQQVLDRLECLGHREAAQHARIMLNYMIEQLQNLHTDLKRAEERAALELDDVLVPHAVDAGVASSNDEQHRLRPSGRRDRR